MSLSTAGPVRTKVPPLLLMNCAQMARHKMIAERIVDPAPVAMILAIGAPREAKGALRGAKGAPRGGKGK